VPDTTVPILTDEISLSLLSSLEREFVLDYYCNGRTTRRRRMAKGLFVVSRCKSDSICLLHLHHYHPVKRCKREERKRLLSAIYKTV
jgi:hypothetical protein